MILLIISIFILILGICCLIRAAQIYDETIDIFEELNLDKDSIELFKDFYLK